MLKRNKTTFLLLVILAVLLGLGVIYAHSSGLTAQKLTRQQKPRIDKKEESRKIYKGLGNKFSTKLTESAAKSKGDIKTEIEIGLPTINPFAPSSTFYDRLKSRSCDADAIVIATVKSEASFLTEDESFIYTNHKVTVEEILKDNSTSPIHAGDTITISRTGGTITLNGKKVSAVNKSALPLQLNKQYLLFLTYLPEREAYVADNLSYLLVNNKIIKTTEGQVYQEEESGNDATTLIQSVRRAAAEPCLETQGGK